MPGCVFLDRDGVINHKASPGEYIRSWEEFCLMPGIADWIRLFNSLGLLVIVVTNQRGVSLGRMSAAEVDSLHRKMIQELQARGARIDDVFCCMHAENSCDCRKPKPGLVRQACLKWDIDLSRSLMIGDSERDRGLALACGLPFVLVNEGAIVETAPGENNPCFEL